MKEKITTSLSHLFYLKFAVLPLLIILTSYFNDNIWHEFKQTNTMYQIYTLIAMFLSAIIPVFIINKLPLPKKLWILLLLVFVTPLSILADFIGGHPINFAEIIMFDFILQLTAIFLADVALAILNYKLYKKIDKTESKFLLDIFCLGLILSFYGYYSFYWLLETELKTQLLYVFTLSSTSFAFYKIFSSEYESYSNAENSMGTVAILTMLATWAFLLFLLFGLMFSPN